MADLKTTNIYGDAYVNNKVGINTTTPATRLQIGQLSPTAATEGIQFGDDTSTRIYRGASGQINFNGTINVLGNTYLGDANGDTVFVNDTIRIGATDSGDASLFFGEGSVAGSDYGARWYWDSGYTFYWYTRNAGTDTQLFNYVTNDLSYVNWNRNFNMQNYAVNYCGQVHFNGGTRFVNNNTSYLIFRSDSTGAGGILIKDGSDTTKGYTGYWDSNGGGILNNSGNWAVRYNFGSTNTGGQLYGGWTIAGIASSATYNYAFLEVTDTNNFWITPGNNNWGLYFETTAGGLLGGSGDSNRLGFVGSGTARFYVDLNNGNGWFGGTLTAAGNISAANLSGTNTGDQSIGNGTITIAAGTGIGVGTTNTFTMNQSGATTVTVTNNGVTSNVAGTGISVSGATGAVTITNSGVTSAVAGTGVSVSGATGAVTFSIGQAVATTSNPTFGTLQLTRLNFGATGATPYSSAAGEGTGNGITFGGDEAGAGYRIFTAMENYGGNYSKLTLNWHTGIRIGAYVNYGGVRFYNNAVGASNPAPSEIFSVGRGDSHVRVENYLLVGGYLKVDAGTSENPTIGQIWTQNTADNYLRKSTPAHFRSQVTDAYYLQVNPDGDGVCVSYSDNNPTFNGVYVGGGWYFGADGSTTSGGLTAKILNAYGGGVNSTNGYYVGNNDFLANSNTTTTTLCIDSSNNHFASGVTMTYLTGAYQNTTVYDSPKTQSATPSRGIRAPASSIQFTDSHAIAPYWTYRSTGDWPVPYGIGWGTGGESSGIFQRFASNGYSLGDMIFYTGNDGSGAFSFRRHTWEGTAHFAAGSGELATELFRVDWAGKATAISFGLTGGFVLDANGAYGQFNNWVHLPGYHGLYSTNNGAHFYPNNASYGSWRIAGTRNSWYGIEFDSGTCLMMNSSEVGFYRVSSGWQMRWYAGTGYVYKGNPGGGTEATILDSVNCDSYVSVLNSNNSIKRTGSSGNYNTDFQNTPAGSVRHLGDDASITNSPGGTWWFVNNYRHSNSSNYWGTQVAWGWEDNANRLATRNVIGGTFGSWVYYLNSGNYTSYAIARGGDTLDGTIYFRSNKGATSTVGANSTYGLEAYSSDAGAAGMSFHRGGYYAVNMGLDPDNVLRIGGWSAAANRWQLDMSGNNTIAGTMTATSFSGAGTGLTGTAANLTAGTVTTNANLTGDVTSTGNATTIANNAVTTAKINNSAVTYAKIQNESAYTVLGNSNASAAAAPAELSMATLAGMLSGNTMNIAGSSTSCTGNAGSVTYLPSRTDSTAYPVLWGAAYTNGSGTIAYSCAAVTIQSSTGTVNATTFSGAGTGLTGTAASLNVGGTAGSISGYNNPAAAANASTIAYRDANADLTTRYFLANRTTAAAGQCGIQLQTGGTSKWWMYLRTNDDANLVFYTSNSPADDVVRMSSTGMGIKIDPSNRLHVNGPGTSPASNTAHCAIRVDNTGATGTEVGSNSRNFAGWLPISVDGNLRWIRIFS